MCNVLQRCGHGVVLSAGDMEMLAILDLIASSPSGPKNKVSEFAVSEFKI